LKLKVICLIGLFLVSANGQDSKEIMDGGTISNSENPDKSSSPIDTTPSTQKTYRQLPERFKERESRTSQFDKRLGLSSRKHDRIDPQVFAQRGHELQNQFYMIDGKTKNSNQWPTGSAGPTQKVSSQKGVNKLWLFWVGAAGLAGASAGVTAFLLLDRAHPSQGPPKLITLTDQP
jgi:hypothetical protein